MLTERQRHWQAVIDQWQSSGLNQTTFCQENAIDVKQFYAWKSLLKKRLRSNSSARVQTNSLKSTVSSEFIPLTLVPTAAQNMLTLSIGSVTLSITPHTQEDFALRWIHLLSEVVTP